jgi:hypothetical protein
MAFVRDIFTGELQERDSGPGGRQVIFQETPRFGLGNSRRRGNPWDRGKDHVDVGMSIKPEEATPEKIAALNENAKRQGTGAYYSPDGLCHTPTRGSRAKEMRGRLTIDFGFQDNDAGYGDCAGR